VWPPPGGPRPGDIVALAGTPGLCADRATVQGQMMRYIADTIGRFVGAIKETGVPELDDAIEARLQAAGRLLGIARRRARLSQQDLATRARVAERTVRRIEHGEAALLNSYWSLARVLGLPPDWFVQAHDLLDEQEAAEQGAWLAEEALERLGRTGWFGPEALAFLREYVAFTTADGGPGGAADMAAAGYRSMLVRSRAEATLRAARRR
jgi:transcriptional regulator with XRE-family HTH domain